MSETATDTTARALTIALGVAFICALLVSAVSEGLRPIQKANIEAERIGQLELVLKALSDIGRAETIADLEARIIELDTGRYVDSIDVTTFNAEKAATRSASSIALSTEADLAGIKRRELYAQVYLVRDSEKRVQQIILPVRGRGYQSTLRAWLVLDGDTKTVRALKFYQHGETPGVGSRIEDPEWQAQWQNLRAFDNRGVPRLGIRQKSGDSFDEYSQHKVDAISGATRTTQGVEGMLQFWLGENGYLPYLRRLQQERL